MSLSCIKHGTETASFLGHRKLLGMQHAQSAEEHSEMKLRLGYGDASFLIREHLIQWTDGDHGIRIR